jgi:4-hydroxy-2-oxoheptanedioate aldolase
MKMPLNQFKQALKEKRPQIGLWLALANAYSAELCATADYDWMVIDGEHAPNDVGSVLAQLQALAPYPTHPVVRPLVGEIAQIKQLLDIGAQTLLIPMVETADQAAQLVDAIRYPPSGVRGVGSSIARASKWNKISDYLQQADDQICLLLQVESKAALENIDAIAAVAGVDGVFLGPSDLSASLGYRGNPGQPEVQRAIENAIARILAVGKAAGILTVDNSLARHYLELGCTFVAVGVDATLLAHATRTLIDKFKNSAKQDQKKK